MQILVKTYIILFIALTAILTDTKALNPIDSLPITQKPFTVVLDAGHGGRDPGKKISGVQEKDIALKVVKKLGVLLEKHKDIKVIYTRTTDKFLPLDERAAIANKAKADLFVSIHCNAAANKNAKGNETWVLGLHRTDDNLEVVQRENAVILLEDNYQERYAGFDPNDPSSFAASLLSQEDFLDNSIEMASHVQTRLEKELKRKNRGVKQAGFAVLRLSYMPSVLIETGFVTNTEERKFLNSNWGQNKMAVSIFNAIKDYQKNRDINNFTVQPIDVNQSKPTTINQNKGLIYKVQIVASSRALETKPYNFRKLTDISRVKNGNIYKYYTGKFYSEQDAINHQKKAIAAGYTDAFIVTIDGNIVKRL